MNQKIESQRFFDLACADRDAAITLVRYSGIKPHIICFHAQQAVEKALKAVMFSQDLPFRRTHDLSECAYILQEANISLPIDVETLALLTPYAVIGRYGGIEDEIISPDEALEIMNIVLDWASNIIEY